MKIFFGTIIVLLLFTIMSSAQNCKIHVEVKGFEEISGKLSIGLFNDSNNFPKKSDNNLGAEIAIVDSVVSYTFSNLTTGEYALAIYHDENSNGKLDSNFLGMPTEDYVFSNYATGNFGPPSFEDAKFTLTDTLDIKLELNK